MIFSWRLRPAGGRPFPAEAVAKCALRQVAREREREREREGGREGERRGRKRRRRRSRSRREIARASVRACVFVCARGRVPFRFHIFIFLRAGACRRISPRVFLPGRVPARASTPSAHTARSLTLPSSSLPVSLPFAHLSTPLAPSSFSPQTLMCARRRACTTFLRRLPAEPPRRCAESASRTISLARHRFPCRVSCACTLLLSCARTHSSACASSHSEGSSCVCARARACSNGVRARGCSNGVREHNHGRLGTPACLPVCVR